MLLLAASVVLTGITACPRGGLCSVIQQAAHKCCHRSEALRSLNCCDAGSQLASRALGPERALDQGRIAPDAVAVLPIDSHATSTSVAFTRSAPRWGLAPPGTLTAQHTSLLL